MGDFSLVVMCRLLSSCGRVQVSCCDRDSMLVSVFMGISSCVVGISVLEVVDSSQNNSKVYSLEGKSMVSTLKIKNGFMTNIKSIFNISILL